MIPDWPHGTFLEENNRDLGIRQKRKFTSSYSGMNSHAGERFSHQARHAWNGKVMLRGWKLHGNASKLLLPIGTSFSGGLLGSIALKCMYMPFDSVFLILWVSPKTIIRNGYIACYLYWGKKSKQQKMENWLTDFRDLKMELGKLKVHQEEGRCKIVKATLKKGTVRNIL